ncbi:MAG: hypothetical protein R3E87_12105 [Burkholderiaceae bacterium]
MRAPTIRRHLPRPLSAMLRPTAIDWQRGLVQGCIVGTLPLIVDLPLPATMAALGAPHALRFLALVTIISMARGVVWAWTAQWVEERLSTRMIVVVFVTETLILTIASLAILRMFDGPWNVGFPMMLWLNLAYGGAFFIYCLNSQRALRVRATMARATLARERSAAALDDERVRAIAARLDPALMLKTLTAIREAYGQHRQRADALLDALVAFLRLAMPAVRGGRSTLRAELGLLRAHDALCVLLDPRHSRCRIEIDDAFGDTTFPPLLLVPLVEAAGATSPEEPRLTARRTQNGLMLTLDATAPPGWLNDTLLQRVQHQLRGVMGAATCPTGTGACSALTLTLPTNPTTPGDRS